MITDFGPPSEGAFSVVLQPDDKILTAGQSGGDFALARYNTDGSLDSSFGTGGLVTTDFGGMSESANSVILLPNGKIVAVGFSNASGDFEFALSRYNSDGSLDSSFGTGGLVTTSFGGTIDRANSAILQPDGKIVAAGESDGDFALARYNSDGSLDSSFGTGGLVTTDFGGTSDDANSVVLQPDGKIVAAGATNASGDFNFALARYNSDGLLDSSFGTGGLVTTDFGGADELLAAVIQANGRIVGAGESDVLGNLEFALARYLIPSITISELARDIRAKYLLLQ